MRGRWCESTAPLFHPRSSRASSSGTRKAPSPGPWAPRQGRFELADGGTIFLDEIGDLSPEVQVKFLRVLQEGEFERVGSSRTRRVDVRVIAATHRDLDALVAEGHFRADLYYRLSVYPIRLPSLHERTADIPRLVWFFINRHQRELGRRITQVPQAVIDDLQRYTWPGNVRELENVIERALIASSGEILELDDPSSLRPQLHKPRRPRPRSSTTCRPRTSAPCWRGAAGESMAAGMPPSDWESIPTRFGSG